GLLLAEWEQSPLEYGMKHYTVRVRVSYDNEVSWCHFGPSCGITTAPGAPSAPRSTTVVGSDPANLRIWPNPLRDGDLNVLLGGLHDDETSAQLTMIDLQGRVIADQRIAAQNGSLNIQLTAEEHLPTDIYLITIRTTARSWTERVVVE
ncbi:MAG: T9SS type A sorting domain-containing protein, partial [Flavobacteriales bacterium]|nr:T9SS type A sorting domain-containing protein [Flavobacteriales bacterium]